MKKITTLALVFLGLGISAQAQQAVSTAIVKQFEDLYANVKDTNWEEDDDGNFVAYFNLGSDYAQATFSKDAKWIKTSTFVDETSLSDAIKAFIETSFTDDFFYTEVEEIETPNNLQYQIEIETDDSIFKMLFDKEGKLLKKEQVVN